MRRLRIPIFLLAACRPSAPEAPAEPTIPEFPDATEARPELPEVAVGSLSLTVDGDLADWSDVQWVGALVSPGDGAPVPDSPVAANFKLAWDNAALYAAFVVRDAEAASPLRRAETDPHVWEVASGIELMLQPGDPGDNTNYYEVQVCAAEAVWDTRFDDYNRPITGEGAERRFGHQDWDAALERAVRVVPGEGYIVEMALPWTSIDSETTAVPPEIGDVWRANIYTFRDGQRHSLAWSALLGQGNFHRSSRFGRIRFE